MEGARSVTPGGRPGPSRASGDSGERRDGEGRTGGRRDPPARAWEMKESAVVFAGSTARHVARQVAGQAANPETADGIPRFFLKMSTGNPGGVRDRYVAFLNPGASCPRPSSFQALARPLLWRPSAQKPLRRPSWPATTSDLESIAPWGLRYLQSAGKGATTASHGRQRRPSWFGESTSFGVDMELMLPHSSRALKPMLSHSLAAPE